MLSRIFIAIIILVFIIGIFGFPLWPNTKWGFIDHQGRFIIPANFERVQGIGKGNIAITFRPQKSFHEGLAAVAINDK